MLCLPRHRPLRTDQEAGIFLIEFQWHDFPLDVYVPQPDQFAEELLHFAKIPDAQCLVNALFFVLKRRGGPDRQPVSPRLTIPFWNLDDAQQIKG